MGIVIFLFPALMVFFWLFFFCNFGDNVTNRFLDVSDDLYGVAWHLLPLDMKKQFPMMISLSQKEIYVRGVGNANCTRELFMQVSIILLA